MMSKDDQPPPQALLGGRVPAQFLAIRRDIRRQFLLTRWVNRVDSLLRRKQLARPGIAAAGGGTQDARTAIIPSIRQPILYVRPAATKL